MSRIVTFPFTQPFIKAIATFIQTEYKDYGADLSRVAIVFGGRRPALFLRRELAHIFKTSFKPPKILTIDELMMRIDQEAKVKQQLHDLDHAYIIYDLVKRMTPRILKNREQFAQFLPWAREIAAFIEHIDLEALKNEDLLNIASAARIGYDVPEEINLLLQDIAKIRQAYHDILHSHNLTVRGYGYLQAAKAVSKANFDEFNAVIFANFFYVHKTEMSVLKELDRQGKAVLLMQGDERRWPALLRIGQQFNQSIHEGKDVIETKFKLNLYAAIDMHSQAGMIASILKNIKHKDKTVIVIPNPDFILPLLAAIGSSLEEFNISMGYPFKRSSVYVILELMIAVQNSSQQKKVYSRDYLKLLHHPFVKNLVIDQDAAVTSALSDACEAVLTGKIISPLTGSLFVDPQDLVNDEMCIAHAVEKLHLVGIERNCEQMQSNLLELHRIFIDSWLPVKCFDDLAESLALFSSKLPRVGTASQYLFNSGAVHLLGDLQQHYKSLRFAKELFCRDELFRIFLDALSREVVSFTGSPLRGLQILGLFETRALSFDHVIIADVNEGVLPNLNIYEPLIPREVMIQLNLDRLELEEEIQRYGFMRLIASAQHVHVLYQDKPQLNRSRFVEELIWEQEKRKGKLGVVDIASSLFPCRVNISKRSAHKTPHIIHFLKHFKYSATSLNAYVRNPYEFYISYVLGLREQDDVLDDPDHLRIGTFVHHLLETTFKPFVGRKPIIDDVFSKHFFDMFDTLFFRTISQGGRADSFMLKAMLRNRLERFLQLETERCQRVKKVLYIEHKFNDLIELPSLAMQLTYRVDRVDEYEDGSIWIIDYKTGSSDIMPKSFQTLESLRSFQMPLYIDFLSRLYPGTPVNVALFHLRTSQFEPFLNEKRKWSTQEISHSTRILLEATMSSLLDENTPFKILSETHC